MIRLILVLNGTYAYVPTEPMTHIADFLVYVTS